MFRPERLVEVFRRVTRFVIVALALVAWLVPAFGGAFGGVCFAGDGTARLGACCRPDAAGNCACHCCKRASDKKDSGSDKAPKPVRRGDDGCVRVDLPDEPTSRPDDSTPRLVHDLQVAVVFAAPFPRPFDAVVRARPDAVADPPPARGSACRPLVLRV